MPTLHIRTLGEFTVRRGDAAVPPDAWPTTKSLSLFKLLLTERGRWVTGERLMETLWPAMTAERAQNNLWVAVSQARRALEPHLPPRAPSTYILSEREGYRFNTDVPYSLDAETFERLVESAFEDNSPHRLIALEAARALYRGDYLPDDRDEEWAAARRAALLDRYLDALGALAAIYVQHGRQRDAISAAREGLRRVPTREDLARPAMLAGALLGERQTALDVYDDLRAALDAAGRSPALETEELIRRIRRSPVADAVTLLPAGPRPPAAGRYSVQHPPLVGRGRELRACERALERAVGGAAKGMCETLLVEGEPGSGKSRLLAEFAALAAGRKVPVLAGVCYEGDQAIPYRAVAAMVEAAHARWPQAATALPAPLRTELVALCPSLGAAETATGRAAAETAEEAASFANLGGQGRLPRALTAWLHALAGAAGLLVTLDNVQWADPSTLRLLRRMTATAGPPLLLACSYSGEELSHNAPLEEFVAQAGRLAHVSHLPLGRLGEQAVGELVYALSAGRGEPAALAAWLHQAGPGNPLALLSALQLLVDGGVLPLRGPRAWHASRDSLPALHFDLPLPDILRALLRQRVQGASAGARRLLECAAVLGRPAPLRVLQAMAGEVEGAVGEARAELEQRALVYAESANGNGALFGVSHEKVCAVVYAEMGAARRVALHRAAAALLEQEANDARNDCAPERAALIARHHEAGRDWPRAVLWLERAAHAALQLAAGSEALAFATRAVALARTHPEETPRARMLELTELRGRTRMVLGTELDGAVEDLEEVIAALDAANPAHSFDLHIAIGSAQANGGQPRPARAHLDEALTIADALGEPARCVTALYHLGAQAWIGGENKRAADYYAAALALCDEHAIDGRPRVQALLGQGETQWAAAAPRAALHCYDQAAQGARRAGARDLEEESRRTVAWACSGTLGVADYARALAALEESLALTDGGEPWHLPLTLGLAGHLDACRGNYGAGLERLGAACALAEGRGQLSFACVVRDLLGDLYADLRLYDAALAEYERAVHFGVQSGAGLWLPRARANLAIARLRLGAAHTREQLSFVMDRARASGMALHALRAVEGLAECALAEGNTADALHFAGTLLERAAGEGMRELEAAARRQRAAAFAQQGRDDAAREEYLAALALAEEVGRVRLQWEVHAALAGLRGGADGARRLAHAAAARALMMQAAAHLREGALRAGLLALRRRLDAGE